MDGLGGLMDDWIDRWQDGCLARWMDVRIDFCVDDYYI